MPRTCLIDFAELWTFAFPTLAVPRTVQVLAQAIEVTHNPDNPAEAQILLLLQAVAYALWALGRLQQDTTVKSLAAYLYHAHWVFAPAVVASSMAMNESDCLALGGDQQALDILSMLPKWDDKPVGSGDLGRSITQAEAVSMLMMQLPENPELRPSQIAYTKAVHEFSRKRVKLREKMIKRIYTYCRPGRGIGKTLAYLGSGAVVGRA
ncbi:MAG: hypothetical protein HRT36_01265 [Alphaproteobacteria bacterium]|nr:hypothetical protein [Alphaproteobacteria bacterium]